MGKIIAIDYGTKRVGLAETDELQIIASPLGTLHSNEVIGFLKRFVASNSVDCWVVGDPKNLDNTPAQSSEAVHNFVRHLKRNFPDLPIHLYDERFTSKMAKQALLDGGMKKKKRRQKEQVDTLSAVIILQSFLQNRHSQIKK